jgi:cytidyltransferase-like protein
MSRNVLLSGFFDPLHAGHTRAIRAARLVARARGGRLIVCVHSDDQKNDQTPLTNQDDRLAVVMSMREVNLGFIGVDTDGSVCESMRLAVRRWGLVAVILENPTEREVEVATELKLNVVALGIDPAPLETRNVMIAGPFGPLTPADTVMVRTAKTFASQTGGVVLACVKYEADSKLTQEERIEIAGSMMDVDVVFPEVERSIAQSIEYARKRWGVGAFSGKEDDKDTHVARELGLLII